MRHHASEVLGRFVHCAPDEGHQAYPKHEYCTENSRRNFLPAGLFRWNWRNARWSAHEFTTVAFGSRLRNVAGIRNAEQ